MGSRIRCALSLGFRKRVEDIGLNYSAWRAVTDWSALDPFVAMLAVDAKDEVIGVRSGACLAVTNYDMRIHRRRLWLFALAYCDEVLAYRAVHKSAWTHAGYHDVSVRRCRWRSCRSACRQGAVALADRRRETAAANVWAMDARGRRRSAVLIVVGAVGALVRWVSLGELGG